MFIDRYKQLQRPKLGQTSESLQLVELFLLNFKSVSINFLLVKDLNIADNRA